MPFQLALALTNNLALTPQMGWNDWNSYGCGVSESAVTNTAGIMVANGMKAAGYQFVNIDDGWAGSRDSNGVIQAYSIATKFPDGIPWLADYVHARGLKLGIYTDHGTNTCSHCIGGVQSPGSFGYEYVDAFAYGSWSVDYLKNDSCNLPSGDVPHDDYSRMADGLMKSRQLVFASLCPNAAHYEYWSPDVGNSWRTTGDIKNTFASMISKIDQNSKSAYLAGPGRWNDPDMLEIGNGEFATNLVGAQTHFTMWCIMAAPLIAGNNLTTMSPQTLQILTNAEAIAVDQDPAGEQGERVGGIVDSAEVWSKPLGYDFTTRAVALLNRSTNNSAVVTCNWTNLAFQPGTAATVFDLWAHQDLGRFTNNFTATIPPYGSMLLKIVGTPIPPPSLGTNFLTGLQPIYAYCGFGAMTNNVSIGGNPLTLNGVVYTNGIGTHAIGGNEYNLGGICSRFHATIGVDDEVGTNGSVIFQVLADGRKIYDSGITTGGMTAQTVDLDMTGVRRLTIGVTDTGNDVTGNRNAYDHSDWADAFFVVTNTTPQMPEAPMGLAASPGNSITLTWNNTLAAISYNVERSTVSGSGYTNIASVPVTAFTDSNVVSGTTYYYVVSAVSSFGEGSNSMEVAAESCSPPAVPSGVTTVSTNSQITVDWNASAGAASYTVSRFTASTPPVVAATGLTATNFTDTSVAGGATYYYLVAAVNACNQSASATFVPAIVSPNSPAGLTAAAGNAAVILNWSAPLGATGYNVKRSSANGGPYATLASAVPATSYLDFAVTNGATYYYVVSAVNAGGESANSSQVAVTPEAPLTAYWTNTISAAPQNWNVNANWTNSGVFPNSIGELAVVNANITAPQTINLNEPVTIGSLDIGALNGSAACTVAANGGSLIFSATNQSVITELASSGGDTIAAPVTITTNLIVINNSTNPLTLAGPLSSSGGSVTIGSGILQVGDGTTNGSLGSITVADNAALVFNRSDDVTMSGVISGSGTVTQAGSGVLTLSGSNTFSGGVMIQDGTMQAGNASALGSTSGNTIVTNNGTLDVNGFNLTGEAVTVSAAGVGVNGAIISGGGQQTYALRNVTLAGDTTFGGVGPWNPSANINRWDIRAASNSSTNGCTLSTGGHPYKLTKTGGNQISLVAVNMDPALGDIDIQQGLMGWETVTSSMGNPASNIIVRAGATLSFYNASTAWNKHFILYGDGIHTNLYNWSGANIIIGPVQLNGNNVFWGGGTSLLLSNVVSGSGGIIKNGTYRLILAAANTYSGNTTLNSGNLVLTNNGSISTSAVIVVGSGATLDASGRFDGSLALVSGQKLTGNGSVNGNVTVGNGATLAPGGSLTTLTFNGNLILAGGSTTLMELSKTLATNDVAQVTSNLTYGGTLALTNLNGGVLVAGDNFKLFNASSYGGAFTNIVPAIPALNLAWNTDGLTNGMLTIVSATTSPPKFGGITVNGNGFVFSGTNGVPSWPYQVLASTNASSPLTNWTIISTNTFDDSGHFNFTIPANPAMPQMFYLLKMQ